MASIRLSLSCLSTNLSRSQQTTLFPSSSFSSFHYPSLKSPYSSDSSSSSSRGSPNTPTPSSASSPSRILHPSKMKGKRLLLSYHLEKQKENLDFPAYRPFDPRTHILDQVRVEE
jgi:hypothetical protein